MKRFKSGLQRLQGLREQQEKLAGIRFASCKRHQQQINDQIQRMQRALQTLATQINSLLANQPTTADIVHGSRSLYQLQQTQLYQLQNEFRDATQSVEQSLKQWNSVRSELKAISHRVERQRAEHRREQFLHEEHAQQETTARVFQNTGVTGQGSEA